ncbi:MAG: prephenate dehydrogenase [candidate division Zixibacteria bacterium]|nr:prephenate dehydrogenase [candidate division Zixibacteria bacterium]
MTQVSRLSIGILGLGQIGGSIATRLSTNPEHPTIIGYDLVPDLCASALQNRIVTRIAASETELVAASDVVIIALPIGEIINFLKKRQHELSGKVAVMDTGSVKTAVIKAADELRLVNFVGGHPMAGTERHGAASWNPRLFEAANFFLSSSHRTSAGALDTAQEVVRLLGATPIHIDPDRHDRLLALTSNLAHVIAYAMTSTCRDCPDGIIVKSLFRSPSFLGATRVADSDPEMVFHMLWHNRTHLSPALAALLRQLLSVQKAIDGNDSAALRKFLNNT